MGSYKVDGAVISAILQAQAHTVGLAPRCRQVQRRVALMPTTTKKKKKGKEEKKEERKKKEKKESRKGGEQNASSKNRMTCDERDFKTCNFNTNL